jgi:hypothetical protein
MLYLTGEIRVRFRARGDWLGLRALRDAALASFSPLFAGLHAAHTE